MKIRYLAATFSVSKWDKVWLRGNVDEDEGWGRFEGDYTTEFWKAMREEGEPVDDDWLEAFAVDAEQFRVARGLNESRS